MAGPVLGLPQSEGGRQAAKGELGQRISLFHWFPDLALKCCLVAIREIIDPCQQKQPKESNHMNRSPACDSVSGTSSYRV